METFKNGFHYFSTPQRLLALLIWFRKNIFSFLFSPKEEEVGRLTS